MGYVRADVPVGHAQFGKMQICSCRQGDLAERRLEQLRELSNLTALGHYTFESFIPEGHGLTPDKRDNLRQAYERAYAYAQNPQGWLILRGGYGCGKTHLAAAIANARVALGHVAVFVNVPDLLDYLRASFSPAAETGYEERFDLVRNCELLILDDLGTESSTPWAQEKLYQIFNARYALRLPTVITTNHELEEIDVRVRSRMTDPVLCEIVGISAPDFRGSGVGQAQSELSSLTWHVDRTFETFEPRGELPKEQRENLRRALDLAQAYAEAPDGWLVFTGPGGSGKTHLAAAIANAYGARSGRSALFVVVPDLLDHLRAAFGPQSMVPYDKRFEEVRNAPLLVLDDLGTESATAWAREKLYQLFNHRYNARLPTVITTAIPIDELDPRLATRIADTSRCTVFALTVPAFRGVAPARRKARR
jgi:DNA replication protein DnaC